MLWYVPKDEKQSATLLERSGAEQPLARRLYDMIKYRILLDALRRRIGKLPPVSTDDTVDGSVSRVLHDIFAEDGVAAQASWTDYDVCDAQALHRHGFFRAHSYGRCAFSVHCLYRGLRLAPAGQRVGGSMIAEDAPNYAPEVGALLVAFLQDVHATASDWGLKQSAGLLSAAVSLHLARNVIAWHLFESSGAEVVAEMLHWPPKWASIALSEEAIQVIEMSLNSLTGVPPLTSLLIKRVRAASGDEPAASV